VRSAVSSAAGRTSCRKEILRVIDENLILSDDFMTAMEIKRKIPDYSLSTVSSTLVKMVKRGTLIRQKGVGVRGGHGYNRALVMDVHTVIARHLAEEINARIERELFEEIDATSPQDDRSGALP
jgi:hypothetical protein